MRLFSKHNEVASPGKDKVAKGIAEFILKMNSGFARYMKKLTAKLSSSTMKVFLIVFLAFGTTLSFYFVIASFITDEHLKTFRIDRISIPRNVEKDGDESAQQPTAITMKEYDEMKGFTHYMDSLKGSRKSDSILLNRPGLMDSVKMLQQIYEQQNKGK